MHSAAEYFCEDTKKFKLEDLLKEILLFVRQFQSATEVSVYCSWEVEVGGGSWEVMPNKFGACTNLFPKLIWTRKPQLGVGHARSHNMLPCYQDVAPPPSVGGGCCCCTSSLCGRGLLLLHLLPLWEGAVVVAPPPSVGGSCCCCTSSLCGRELLLLHLLPLWEGAVVVAPPPSVGGGCCCCTSSLCGRGLLLLHLLPLWEGAVLCLS